VNSQAGFGTSFEDFATNEFALEAGEEALRHGIIYQRIAARCVCCNAASLASADALQINLVHQGNHC